ncbi:hypothetical protein ABZ791_30015 [Streptomyces huasconensis]|uniref:Uncharacterized protein n=1 Tax=Streptomyces huasconensis TaxID=1854574 RepID=A0ABV3M1I2_9ACTN
MTDVRLRDVAREELAFLWDDLHDAQCSAAGERWSMACDRLVERIKALTQLVGPTPWDEVQIPLLVNGVYQRIHDELGIPVTVDMERVARA